MTPEEAITVTLAKFPTVRATPVRNVAYWSSDRYANAINFEQDRKAYGWKGPQLQALRMVLRIQNKI